MNERPDAAPPEEVSKVYRQCEESGEKCGVDEPYPTEIRAGGILCGGCGRSKPSTLYRLAAHTEEPLAHRPAVVFPPAEFIRDEMKEREWGEDELAARAGVSLESLAAVMEGDSLSPDMVRGLARAFGTSEKIWANLSAIWDCAARALDYELKPNQWPGGFT